MPTKGVFYGVAAVFVALLIVASSLVVYYYGQEQQASAQNGTYVGELSTALSNNRALAGQFNSSLQDYQDTLSLLSEAVASLNTSTPAYQNASVALPSLWSSYQHLASTGGMRVLAYAARMLVEFGNGTLEWYNDTAVEPGWNGYVATVVLLKGNVQAIWYPQYGEHLVTGIDGVTPGASRSWFFWDYQSGGWTTAQTGADGLRVNNGTTFAWTLCGYDTSYNPTCTP